MNRFTSPSSQIPRDTDPPIDGGSGLPIPPAGHIEHDQNNDDSFSDGMDSAMRKHSAAHATIEKLPRYMLARVCVFLIMLMWVIPGFLKVKDLSGFMGVVEQHEVIPEQYEPLLLWVGPGELVMGLLLVFVMGSEFRKPFGKLVLVLSAGLIGMFTYYLSLVDPVVLQESGCGCLSDYRIASGIEDGPRYFAYGKNILLIILHVVALFGPRISDSLRKTAP